MKKCSDDLCMYYSKGYCREFLKGIKCPLKQKHVSSQDQKSQYRTGETPTRTEKKKPEAVLDLPTKDDIAGTRRKGRRRCGYYYINPGKNRCQP